MKRYDPLIEAIDMGYPAFPRTDERGHRLVGQFPGNMKAQPLVENRVDPWMVRVEKMETKKLGILLGINSKFHLIASYLVNEKGFSAARECKCGKEGIIRSVVIDGREYRSDAYRIFERRTAT